MLIALAHDWLCGYRGGEAVLDRIVRLCVERFEVSGLYVMLDDGAPLTAAIDALPKVRSLLQHVPGAPGRLRRWMLPLYPMAVSSLSRKLRRDHQRRPIDLLISTSSAAIKGLRPPGGVPHLCYCHAPARYLWSQREEYSRGGSGGLRSLGLSLCGERLRRWDAATSANVTRFLANSTHTAAEIKRRYGRDAHIVWPPVRTDFLTPDPSVRRDGSWLLVGALEPYKRADLAILAAAKAGKRLTVVGGGSQAEHLRAAAGPNVTFAGRVSDDELRRLYRSASALLFPQVEDFGIVAAEALACGLPVIARRAGGAIDILSDNHTGAFFDEPTVESLLAAAERLPDPSIAAEACRRAAERFAEDRFDGEVLGAITATARHG